MARDMERTFPTCANDLRLIADAIDAGLARPAGITESYEIKSPPLRYGEGRVDFGLRVQGTPMEREITIVVTALKTLAEILRAPQDGE
jgi:hypothetical protein